MSPTLSVIIPVFNGRATIKKAVDSVLSQTMSDYELIVVDDASTDNTDEIINSIGSSRISVIRHASNRGAAAARNTGIKAARGHWIAFLDADDSWPPGKLERQFNALTRSPRRFVASVTGFALHKEGESTPVYLHIEPENVRREILFGCAVSPGSTLMIERSVYDEVGLLDENMRRLEDWDWLLRFSKQHSLLCIAEPLADIYVAGGSAAGSERREAAVIKAIELIESRHLPRLASSRERRQLRSSLLVERAASHYRRGEHFLAAYLTARAFSVYPIRNAAFFSSLSRVIQSRFRKSR